MSSHLLNEVQEICDEIAMIDHGKLLVYDTLANVTRRFSGDGSTNDVQIELLKDIDDQTIGRSIATLTGVLSAEKINSRNVRIRFSGNGDDQARLLSDLAAMRIGMISFKPSASALEDTYLNLIKDTL
jgi:ABC-2 type transport system ATP-binding protein